MSKIIKIYADWCGPCKQLSKMLEENNIQHESVDIDSDKGNELAEEYNIRALPVILVLDDDDILIDKKVGLPSSVDYLKEYETNKA